MRKHTILALGFALTLPCLGAWAQDANQNPQNAPAPGAVRVQEQTTTQDQRGPMFADQQIHSPMQEFVSHQVAEVAALSQQVEQAKAENRPDAARTLTHMIRDHVLVADAAKDILALRNQPSRPVWLSSDEPMATTLADMIRNDIAMHEQALQNTQKLLGDATTPEEKSVYQHAVDATQKHLDWLKRMDQGERVDMGFFGPTAPLSQIAALPAQVGTQRVAAGRVTYRGHRRVHRRVHRRTYGHRSHRRARSY